MIRVRLSNGFRNLTDFIKFARKYEYSHCRDPAAEMAASTIAPSALTKHS